MTLIDKLSALTGPDREVDAIIHEALGNRGFKPSSTPLYSASIDAAMTLVPEGCDWSVTSNGSAHVWKPGAYYAEISEYGKAATPALALVIASFRARNAPAVSIWEGK